jgi:serine/threonine-protein kinase
LCTTLALAQAAPARAEEAAETTPAVQLFDEARALMEDEKYVPACPKLERSQKLDPQLGTQLHLGHCYEKLGEYAAAYKTFQAAAELAALRNQQGVSEPREKIARERASKLEGRLSLLELRPADSFAELTVTLDGVPIDRAQWNRPFPIAPGDHVLRASAPGRSAWEQPFKIGAPAKRGIAIPMLKREATRTEQPPAAAPAAALVVPTTRERRSSGSLQRIAGYVALGTGAVGLGLGALFGLLRTSKVSELAGDCDLDLGICAIARGDQVARQRIESLHSQASTFATGANIAWIAGGIAVASGVVLILTTPQEDKPTLTLGIAPGGLTFTAQTNAL